MFADDKIVTVEMAMYNIQGMCPPYVWLAAYEIIDAGVMILDFLQ